MEFFDADFANTLLLSSESFIDKSLGECCRVINDMLIKAGFDEELLTVGKLKDIEDFNLNDIIVRDGYKITLRFNNFSNALKAHKFIMNF